MFKFKNTWIYSPSDLTTFYESEFATWMDRYSKEFPDSDIKPDSDDGLNRVLQKRGLGHESAAIEQFEKDGRKVIRIKEADVYLAFLATQKAMHDGYDVIYQASLRRGQFAGYADFLVKVPGKSDLGEFHYEAWDTKLARKLKPYFIIQLCAYSEMLEEMQGRMPAEFAVILGTGQQKRLKVDQYKYFYRHLAARFLKFQENFNPKEQPSPEKYRSFGKWSTFAENLLKEKDSLIQIANINANQIRNLHKAGIFTMAQLAQSGEIEVPKMSPLIFAKIKKQCQMQLGSEKQERPTYEIRSEMEKGKGLWLLPAPSKLDVYFDLEGFPLAEGGLEYLWGSAYIEKGQIAFKDFWAHDQAEEKTAFESFIDWAYARWRKDPKMHIYHYAPYETEALKRLMGRYATREEEVDNLLRNGVFVDLYTVVKQGLWIGAPSYSIKKVELIYRSKRNTEVADGGASVEYYQAWLDEPDGKTWAESKLLREIRDYNKDDCDSTYELAKWLQEMQKQAGIPPYQRSTSSEEEDESNDSKEVSHNSLKTSLQAAGKDRPEAELLVQLLDFYQREDKPKWWRYFSRLEMSESEICDDEDCLGGLKKTSLGERPEKRSKVVYFAYNPYQETKLSVGDKCVMQHDPEVEVEIFELNTIKGFVTIKVNAKREIPERINLIPKDYINNNMLRDGIKALCGDWNSGGKNSHAVTKFLRGDKPQINSHAGGPLLKGDSSNVASISDLVHRMDETTLCLQGPPGAGKTYIGKHLIASLIKAGKKVGITSNSHKAINNLMLQAVALCKEADVTVNAIKVKSSEELDIIAAGIGVAKSGSQVPYGGPVNLVGGTAWTFAHENARGQFDYLFVDEAGQVSLANFVAMGLCAKNIILLGDQMQLSQPIQGFHPGKSGLSCLDFLLGEHATVPPDSGIFLEYTRRMHPDVCQYVSDIAYDGRLQAAEVTSNRIVKLDSNPKSLITRESGLIFIPSKHEGNSRSADEEVLVISQIAKELVGRAFTDDSGKICGAIELQDILFIAPYNLQVRKLKEALGNDARVGSIDKFQGQEARIVILSMCSSSVQGGGGRGIDFLFSKNRINVAISRAQSLAIVVGNPDLGATYCSNTDDMALVNLYCWLMEYARRPGMITQREEESA